MLKCYFHSMENDNFSLLSGFIVIFLTLICWMVIGPIISLFILSLDIFNTDFLHDLGRYLIAHIPYILMFLSIFLGSRLILRQRLTNLIVGKKHGYRWKYFFQVFGIYILLLSLFSLIEFKTIVLDRTPFSKRMLILLPILLLTPMQALSEELLFRALPARLVYQYSFPKNIFSSLPIIFASGFLFLLPHLNNPEVKLSVFSIIYYFLWGALAMALGIYTDGFEAPIAMHIANNLYIALIVNYSESSMPTHAIFINKATKASSIIVLETILVFLIIFLFSYNLRKKHLL